MEKLYLVECKQCGARILNDSGTAYCPKHGLMDVVKEFYSAKSIPEVNDLYKEVRKLVKEVKELKKEIRSGEEHSKGKRWVKVEDGYKCKVCGKVLDSKKGVHGHLRIH